MNGETLTVQDILHRRRMLAHLKKQIGKRPLTPFELAEAIKQLKAKYPLDFPQ
jgi:hypothetical protein